MTDATSSCAIEDKPNLCGLSRQAIADELLKFGLNDKQAKMRSKQLWRWIYNFGICDFQQMTDISKELRSKLETAFKIERPNLSQSLLSKDGTRKWLADYGPNIQAETVFIPDVAEKSGALCVSSQVGCTLNCTFCHTGTQKLVRNLTAAEIVQQVMFARDGLSEWPTPNGPRELTNIVFMGMGEPLYNLDNVAEAIDIISDAEGLAIGRRRITVSSAGVADELQPLGERTGAMLAISLHATHNDLRDEIVPINRKFPLEYLLAEIRQYPGLSNAKRVTFEYVMLKGVNDSLAEARELVKMIAGIPAKINLIPFNPWPGSHYECSDMEQIEAFAHIINRAGYASPIRKPRGQDILAACGQLRSESEKQKASERLKARLKTKQIAQV